MTNAYPKNRLMTGVFCAVLACALFASTGSATNADQKFVARDAEIQGAKIHYTIGGHGPAVILLHGYAETSRMWTPLFPLLADKFIVIAPDLPGIGDSSIPADGWEFRKHASLATTSD
jgi:alpha-beta hydrolase superfamily lysophospholipase